MILIPGPPWFSFLLGPRFWKRYRVPFVIDYIDPWISDWTARARFPQKRWAYHRLAAHYEKKVFEHARFVTAVSQGICEDLRRRHPFFPMDRYAAMPYGVNTRDFEIANQKGARPPDFTSGDGRVNLCFTGALQPHGFEMLRALFAAVKSLEKKNPALFNRLCLRFYGTSNLTWGQDRARVLPAAEACGLRDRVTEIPERVPYLQALAVQKSATINVVMGSSDKYYHASKLYTCLAAKKPILAICHEESSIAPVMRSVGLPSVVTFGQSHEISSKAPDIAGWLERLSNGFEFPSDSAEKLLPYSAEAVTGQLAKVFDRLLEEK